MKNNQLQNFIFFKKTTLSVLLALVVFLMSGVTLYANESISQQEKLVKGTVKEMKSSNPLPGVTVVIKGKTVGTVTDIDGKFSINANENDILVFSYIGYIEKEIAVGNKTNMDVDLEEDLYGIDEVVVTGYGVQKKSDLTGAISSVSGDKLTKLPIANVEQALQGQAAGVNIVSKSGRPGEGVDIKIRGISSINGTQPLVIIDGVAGDLTSLNPNDIASVEVLKDASSAAIYGSTGGNGVILVTTKKGGTGKMRTSMNAYRGVESVSNKIEMMNSQEWMAVNEELAIKGKDALNSRPDTLKTYDWQDIVFEPAITQSYDVSTSGGNEVSNILISASYNKQEGIVRNTDYQRFTFRINSEHKITDRITFDEKISFMNSVGKGMPQWQWHDYYANPMYTALTMDPSVPAYNADGTWTRSDWSTDNPLVALDMEDRTAKHNNFEGNFGLKINILKGLEYTSRFSGKLNFGDTKEFQGKYFATETDNRTNNFLIQSMRRDLSYTAQNILNYQTTIAQKHNISAMVGMEASKWWYYDISGTRSELPSSDPWMLYLSTSTDGTSDIQNVEGTGGISANLAYFGRLNYDYMGKYLVTLNFRRDGSSSFGPSYRWGNFPSFSFGWKFTEEGFMKDITAISFGKLRFGYGQTGANAKSGFPYLSQVVSNPNYEYSFDNVAASVGTGPYQIANSEIRWESVNMSNLGLDLSLFENRLSVTADVFNKVNDGMLMLKEVSRIAGTFNGSNPEVNVGSIQNRGYELTITARKQEGELKGSIDLNLTGVQNKVLALSTDSMLVGRVHVLQPTNLTCVGQPIAQFYGYLWDRSIGNGLFRETDPQQKIGPRTVITNQPYYIKSNGDTTYAQLSAKPGDVRYKDVNGDGKINLDDKVNLGSPLPKLTFGFSVNLEYKGFDLSAFFNGSIGNKILNGTKQYTYYLQGNGNHAKAFADRYVEADIIKKDADGNDMVVVHQNLDTDIPRNESANYNMLSEFFIEDGSYLMLKNLVLGYTVPKQLSSKIGLEKVRVYAGGKNLITLTKYTGFSPEVAGIQPQEGSTSIMESGVDLGVYPTTKMVYFGVNLSF